MSKLRIMSDLHLEFGPLDLKPAGEDVLVLAGAIGIATDGATWALNVGQKLGVPVVMIAGNHEFYGWNRERGDITSVYNDLHEVAAKSNGALVFLQNEAADVAGVRFIGATLWTDFNLFDNAVAGMLSASAGMNDYRRIRATEHHMFTPGVAVGEHQKSRAFIETELAQKIRSTVVVTHHAPSRQSIAGRYARDEYSPAYASNLDNLVGVSGAALWVHGHVHHSFDYMLGDTRVKTNPRGYDGYELNPDFNAELIVEI